MPYSLQIGERRQRQDVIAQQVEYASKLVLVRSQIFAVHVIRWAIQCCQPWHLKDSASWLATPKVPFMWSPNQSFPFGITCEILPGVRAIPLASTHCTRAFQNWPPWKFQRRCKIFKVAFQGHQAAQKWPASGLPARFPASLKGSYISPFQFLSGNTPAKSAVKDQAKISKKQSSVPSTPCWRICSNTWFSLRGFVTSQRRK